MQNSQSTVQSAGQRVQTQQTQQSAGSAPAVQQSAPQTTEGDHVWVSATGTKYHKTNHCGNMNPDTAKEETRAEAEAQGLEPCKKCY